jgi:tRNA(Arg) A34 adenosine deaminase TadA
MPAINRASDLKQRRNFVLLHSISVIVTLSHIVVCAALLYLIPV